MRLTRICKYNVLIRIPGLEETSLKLAKKGLYLKDGGTLVAPRFPGTPMGRSRVFKRIGRQLWKTGKFSALTRIDFPEDPARIRNFIRLVVRTKATVEEAARATGVEVEDLSRYQPSL